MFEYIIIAVLAVVAVYEFLKIQGMHYEIARLEYNLEMLVKCHDRFVEILKEHGVL